MAPPAPDGPLSPEGSAVPGMRCEAGQASNLLSVPVSEFRQVRDECCGGNGSYAWRALQADRGFAEVRVGLDQVADYGFDAADLLIEEAEHVVEALAHPRVIAELMSAGALLFAHLDHLAASAEILAKPDPFIGAGL